MYIREAAEKFAEEIEDLKKTMSDAFGEWEAMAEKDLLVKGLGKLDDLQRIEEEISEVQTEVMTDKKQFKVCIKLRSATVMSCACATAELKITT